MNTTAVWPRELKRRFTTTMIRRSWYNSIIACIVATLKALYGTYQLSLLGGLDKKQINWEESQNNQANKTLKLATYKRAQIRPKYKRHSCFLVTRG